jgi:hypothetical protein
MVIVNRSLEAAKAMTAGNKVNRIASDSMMIPFDELRLMPYAALVESALAAASFATALQKAKRPRCKPGALS